MADITDTLARIVNIQADELARLRKINDGLVADGREQAKTIRTLVDQRGAVAEVAPMGQRLRDFWGGPGVKVTDIADRLDTSHAIVWAIINGQVDPIGDLRQRIEALIGGEVDNG